MKHRRVHRRDPLRRAMQTYVTHAMKDGDAPTVREVAEGTARERTMSLDDLHRALDRYALDQARDVLTSKTPGGDRRYLATYVAGEAHYAPATDMTTTELRNYERYIDRPNVDAAERAWRRRDVLLTILEEESRIRQMDELTAADVEDMVAVAYEALHL